jgi:putative membrane protein
MVAVETDEGRRTGRWRPDMMEPWGWIWMLVWIVALLFMVWLIVRSPSERSTAEDAMAILRARFARGEISQEEFERAKVALLSDRQEFSQ